MIKWRPYQERHGHYTITIDGYEYNRLREYSNRSEAERAFEAEKIRQTEPVRLLKTGNTWSIYTWSGKTVHGSRPLR